MMEHTKYEEGRKRLEAWLKTQSFDGDLKALRTAAINYMKQTYTNDEAVYIVSGTKVEVGETVEMVNDKGEKFFRFIPSRNWL